MSLRKKRMSILTKTQIRSKIILKLKTQKEEDRNRKSNLIKEKLFKDKVFKRAKRVMFYISFDGEVNTKRMIKEAIKSGKIVAAPVCRQNRMIAPAILGINTQLKKGLYGIYEPAIKKSMNLKSLDLVIVPGVAFDKHRNRLGRGKGYYDRFLKKLPEKTPAFGLAFDFQILPVIPATATDIKLSKILSN